MVRCFTQLNRTSVHVQLNMRTLTLVKYQFFPPISMTFEESLIVTLNVASGNYKQRELVNLG